MFFLALRIIFVFLLSLTASRGAFANEEKPAEGGEAKETKKDEYAQAQAQLAALQAKVNAGEEAIHKLIEEKQSTKDPGKVGDIVKSLVTEHRNLQKNVEEYEQARAYLQYRFPEKGMKEKRQYERVEVKSLEEMENQQSLESRIKKTLGKMRKQYEPPDPEKKAMGSKDKKDHADKRRKTKPVASPEISNPVILTK